MSQLHLFKNLYRELWTINSNCKKTKTIAKARLITAIKATTVTIFLPVHDFLKGVGQEILSINQPVLQAFCLLSHKLGSKQ